MERTTDVHVREANHRVVGGWCVSRAQAPRLPLVPGHGPQRGPDGAVGRALELSVSNRGAVHVVLERNSVERRPCREQVLHVEDAVGTTRSLGVDVAGALVRARGSGGTASSAPRGKSEAGIPVNSRTEPSSEGTLKPRNKFGGWLVGWLNSLNRCGVIDK